MIAQFRAAGVEVRGCPKNYGICRRTRSRSRDRRGLEKGIFRLIISIKVVDGVNEAIEHINRYGSRHTESIVTESHDVAARFMEFVDAAGRLSKCVHEIFRRFPVRLGRGSRHQHRKTARARPCGPRRTHHYKYKLFGKGQTVASYSKGQRTFKHRSIRKLISDGRHGESLARGIALQVPIYSRSAVSRFNESQSCASGAK